MLGVALFDAGIFKINAITDATPSVANDLHTLYGAIVIFTFPIAAALVACSLGRNHESASAGASNLPNCNILWAIPSKQRIGLTTQSKLGILTYK